MYKVSYSVTLSGFYFCICLCRGDLPSLFVLLHIWEKALSYVRDVEHIYTVKLGDHRYGRIRELIVFTDASEPKVNLGEHTCRIVRILICYSTQGPNVGQLIPLTVGPVCIRLNWDFGSAFFFPGKVVNTIGKTFCCCIFSVILMLIYIFHFVTHSMRGVVKHLKQKVSLLLFKL